MSGTRFVTVTPLQLSENPKKYVPEEATVNNIMRTFGRLQSMTEMTNSAGTGKLYEVQGYTGGTVNIVELNLVADGGKNEVTNTQKPVDGFQLGQLIFALGKFHARVGGEGYELRAYELEAMTCPFQELAYKIEVDICDKYCVPHGAMRPTCGICPDHIALESAIRAAKEEGFGGIGAQGGDDREAAGGVAPASRAEYWKAEFAKIEMALELSKVEERDTFWEDESYCGSDDNDGSLSSEIPGRTDFDAFYKSLQVESGTPNIDGGTVERRSKLRRRRRLLSKNPKE